MLSLKITLISSDDQEAYQVSLPIESSKARRMLKFLEQDSICLLLDIDQKDSHMGQKEFLSQGMLRVVSGWTSAKNGE